MAWTTSPKVLEIRRRSRFVDVVVETLDGFRRHLTGRNAAVLTYYGFLTLYIVALALLAVGTFGLFGNEQDPLSGVFLLPLGLPWNLLLPSTSEAAFPWVGVGAPLINLALIGLVCRRFRTAD